MVLLAAAFTVYALSTRHPRLWIFISFPVAYIWFMTQRPLQVPRWVYPLVPLRCGGRCVGARRRRSSRSLDGLAIATSAVVTRWPLRDGTRGCRRSCGNPCGPERCRSAAVHTANARAHRSVDRGNTPHRRPSCCSVRDGSDLSQTQVVTRRVPNLQTALDAGIEQLGGCDWVVVPEGSSAIRTLRQLGFLQRFEADSIVWRQSRPRLPGCTSSPDIPLTGTICGSDPSVLSVVRKATHPHFAPRGGLYPRNRSSGRSGGPGEILFQKRESLDLPAS